MARSNSAQVRSAPAQARLAPWAWAILAAGFYALCRQAYYVGFFNDDAFYIIGARSLLSGAYAQLNVPGHPPLVQYSPGHSLLLAPLAWLAGDRLWPYQAASIAMMALSMGLLYIYLGSRLKASFWPALLLAAFNPLCASMSGAVLAEAPFLLALTASAVYAERVWREPRAGPWLGLFALAGFASLIRPNGAALGLALALALARERRLRLAAGAAFFLAAFALPWWLRNQRLAGAADTHWAELISFAGGSWTGLAGALAYNLFYYLEAAFVANFFRWPAGLSWLAIPSSAIGLGLAFWGLRGERSPAARRFLLPASGLYLLSFLIWDKQASRYLLPLLPFVLSYTLWGLERLARARAWAWGAAALGLALCAPPLCAIIRARPGDGDARTTAPASAFEWARVRSRPEEVFAVDLDGRFFLHTGRQAVKLPAAEGDLLSGLAGVSYVALFRSDDPLRSRRGSSAHDAPSFEARLKSLGDASRYERAFENAGEGSVIFRVKRGTTGG
ncbi:MAG: glycosyltransferase family 39 protein [Elusimicrobia bacterium]|nr:glycosyltransferase family 39 protein [Elusimicrobiota bacterium]